ncbi:hypothetical protein DM02DRAFT_538546 [Periconia macrospinosa]|uniref:Uncharacterized protein n=1 Tax=Periconia macrospinosa TaxID=97972 RepID=A0A2V1DCC4_9PLEO|nr:hypothetical protein DM02DRAFT_538546 [Periconia macrospinosa]
MSSLDNTSFTIQVGGSSIAAPANSVDEKHQAKAGDSQPAIFSLQNGRLQSGDWVLGRAWAEDRSFGPKMVFWFKASDCGDQVQPVTAEQEGETLRLSFSSILTVEDGNIFADLSGGNCYTPSSRVDRLLTAVKETHGNVSINKK